MVARKHTALCFSGLDPSGGAGLLRDLSVLNDHQIHVMAVLMSETVQSSDECKEIQGPTCAPATIFSTLVPFLPEVWGAKFGLLSIPIDELHQLMKLLKQFPPRFLIWDPIMGPTQGVAHHNAEDLKEIAKSIGSTHFFDHDWVISPNLNEFKFLANPIDSMNAEDLIRASKPIFDSGFTNVWLKGGHGSSDVIDDYWISDKECHLIASHPRSQIKPRGTGCYLSSSWLAYRLGGLSAFESARQATLDLQNIWTLADTLPKSSRPILGLKKNYS